MYVPDPFREDRPEVLADAEARLGRWRAAVAAPSAPAADSVLDGVRERLADDLDAPGALAVVDRWAEEVRLRAGAAGAEDRDAGTQVRAVVDALLGVSL